MLFGLVACGCCNGPFSLRGQGRYACSAHVDTRTCDNAHTIKRELLEASVLDGLHDRLMAPEIAAEAVRTYVKENNRLNHARRAASIAEKAERDHIVEAIAGLVTMAEQGLGSRALVDKLHVLEAREDALRARMAEAPSVAPDIHPNIAAIYRDEAADAIRGLIECVTLFPGQNRSEMTATQHGEFGAILEWVGCLGAGQTKTPGSGEPGVLRLLVAGTRISRERHSLSVSVYSFAVSI